MRSFDDFYGVRVKGLLNKHLSVLWDNMTLMWHCSDIFSLSSERNSIFMDTIVRSVNGVQEFDCTHSFIHIRFAFGVLLLSHSMGLARRTQSPMHLCLGGQHQIGSILRHEISIIRITNIYFCLIQLPRIFKVTSLVVTNISPLKCPWCV